MPLLIFLILQLVFESAMGEVNKSYGPKKFKEEIKAAIQRVE